MTMLADAGTLLETIEPRNILGSNESGSAISITDYKFLSSYNWVDDDKAPVIYVPGQWSCPY